MAAALAAVLFSGWSEASNEYIHRYVEVSRDDNRQPLGVLTASATVLHTEGVTLRVGAGSTPALHGFIVGGVCTGVTKFGGEVMACAENGVSIFVAVTGEAGDVLSVNGLIRGIPVTDATLHDAAAVRRLAHSAVAEMHVVGGLSVGTGERRWGVVLAGTIPDTDQGLDAPVAAESGVVPGVHVDIVSVTSTTAAGGVYYVSLVNSTVVASPSAGDAGRASVAVFSSAVSVGDSLNECALSDAPMRLSVALAGGFSGQQLVIGTRATPSSSGTSLERFSSSDVGAISPFVLVVSVDCAPAWDTCTVSSVTGTSVASQPVASVDAAVDGDMIATGIAFLELLSTGDDAPTVTAAVVLHVGVAAGDGPHSFAVGASSVTIDGVSADSHATIVVALHGSLVATTEAVGVLHDVSVISDWYVGSGALAWAHGAEDLLRGDHADSPGHALVGYLPFLLLEGFDIEGVPGSDGVTLLLWGAFSGVVSVRRSDGWTIMFESTAHDVVFEESGTRSARDSDTQDIPSEPRAVIIAGHFDESILHMDDILPLGTASARAASPTGPPLASMLTDIDAVYGGAGLVGSFVSTLPYVSDNTALSVDGYVFASKDTLVHSGVQGDEGSVSVVFSIYGKHAGQLDPLWAGMVIASDRVGSAPLPFVTSVAVEGEDRCATSSLSEADAGISSVAAVVTQYADTSITKASNYGGVGLVRAFLADPDIDMIGPISENVTAPLTHSLVVLLSPRGERTVWDNSIVETIFVYRWFFTVITIAVFVGAVIFIVKYKRGGIRAARYGQLSELVQDVEGMAGVFAAADAEQGSGGSQTVTVVDGGRPGSMRAGNTVATSGAISIFDGMRATAVTSAGTASMTGISLEAGAVSIPPSTVATDATSGSAAPSTAAAAAAAAAGAAAAAAAADGEGRSSARQGLVAGGQDEPEGPMAEEAFQL